MMILRNMSGRQTGILCSLVFWGVVVVLLTTDLLTTRRTTILAEAYQSKVDEYNGSVDNGRSGDPIAKACARIEDAQRFSMTHEHLQPKGEWEWEWEWEWELDAVICYAGTFMAKMLSELNSGLSSSAKSPEHVHLHLQPYLGGTEALSLLNSGESPDNATCFVCFQDADASEGLLELRNTLSHSAKSAFDAVDVCVYDLSAAIVLSIPKEKDGRYLKPLPPSSHVSSAPDPSSVDKNAVEAADIILKAIKLVGVNGCKNNTQ